jgi:hypothetical protein
MTLIVEDGTGLSNSESYVSVVDCISYCTRQGLTFDISLNDPEAALRRAAQFLDYTFRMRFPGTRAKRRAQALEWPRIGAYYYNPDTVGNLPYFIGQNNTYFATYVESFWPYDIIDSMTLPIEIVNATCQAAALEIVNPTVLLTGTAVPGGPPAVALSAGQILTDVKAGDTEIKFTPIAPIKTDLEIMSAVKAGMIMIEATLAPLIKVPEYTLHASRR